jgi:hypothetical protein
VSLPEPAYPNTPIIAIVVVLNKRTGEIAPSGFFD